MVVEQKHYVEAGLREFSKGPVTFHDTVAAACTARKPNLALLSSVLPYLPDPYSLFQEIVGLNIQHLVVDRTFFLRRPGERLTVQTVPEWIYPASYPAWFLDEAKLKEIARKAGYGLVAEFSALDENHPEGEKANAKGFYWTLEDGSR
jgi:putative methyltransferase (TIGR04325 family)